MPVSIIMPSHNAEKFIAAAIDSVRRQTYPDWELIVSDDGSTDNTIPIVERIQLTDNRIQLLRTDKNEGPAHARNLAIQSATGDYIAFLDSDDLWKAKKLEEQIAFMQERGLAFTFSSYDRIDETGKYINTHNVANNVSYEDLLKTCVIGCLTAVYDVRKLGKVYMPNIRKRQDFGLWLRLLKLVEYAVPIPESLAQYRVHNQSVSANKFSAAKYTWSIYRDVEKLGLPLSAYYFMHYAANGLINTFVRPYIGKPRA